MRLKNMKIGGWLLLGFSVILTLVVILGIIAYQQTNELSQQTQTMYNHPLTVRRSIDNLQLSVSELRLEFRNYILADDVEKQQAALDQMDLALTRAEDEFEIIEDRYLGPPSDVSDTYEAFILWSNVRETNIALVELGEIDMVLESIEPAGEEAVKRDALLLKIKVINDYAQNKSDELFENSQELHDEMITQLTIIVISLFLLTVVIGLWLYRSFKRPLAEMNETVITFQEGDMTSRVEFEASNELGILANSINEMAEIIESNERLHTNTNEFSDILISENNIKEFFKIVITSLMDYTDSVASAIYLLDNKTKMYNCFESIGFDQEKLRVYDKNSYEGELGKLLTDKKIQILHVVEENVQFSYNTISMGVIPNEIMSIPLISNDNVVGIITLANINTFSSEAIMLIEQVLDNLTARTEAILATDRINEFILELEQRSNELVAQNAELELQKKQLNEASKLKSNFLSNMSHELRTPLNSVIALSGVLYERLKGEIPEEEYSYLEIIGRNGKNLLTLINDILDISRIESGRVDIDITRFKADTLLNEIHSMFAMQAKNKGVKLIHNKAKTKITLMQDYDKLLHIVQNLVSNAVKFTEEGSVTIEAKELNGNFRIDVIDTGIGISADQLNYIFEEFKQAESGTSRRFGGTGLGLSIAKRYANMLLGDVTVVSEPGRGSTFTLILPKEYTGTSVIESEIMSLEVDQEMIDVGVIQAPFEKQVLLIEDNESAIIQIRDLVRGMGVNLLIAQNGESGLEKLRRNQVDGIILDLMMPGMDGFEVLTQVRNDDATIDIPVLVLTAKHLTKKDLSMLKRNNIYQLVQKGDVDRIELQTLIFNMLYTPKVKNKKIPKQDNPRVLLVEDNEDNIITIQAMLSGVADLSIARDGKEGVEKAVFEIPQIVLMDIALPVMSGIEAYHEIRKHKTLDHVPIIAVTASALKEEKQKILSHGFNDFVAKPVVKEDLIKAIERNLFDD